MAAKLEMIKLADDGVEIATSSAELTALSNVMNEVCNGLHIDDYEKSLGVARETAAELLARVNSAAQARSLRDTESSESAGRVPLLLELRDISVLRRSLDEVVGQIDRDEIHTRIGLDLEEVEGLRSDLVTLADQLGA